MRTSQSVLSPSGSDRGEAIAALESPRAVGLRFGINAYGIAEHYSRILPSADVLRATLQAMRDSGVLTGEEIATVAVDLALDGY